MVALFIAIYLILAVVSCNAQCMSTLRSPIFTRSKSAFCHGDCKSPLIEELPDSKSNSSDSGLNENMSNTETSPGLSQILREMDRLFFRQNEHLQQLILHERQRPSIWSCSRDTSHKTLINGWKNSKTVLGQVAIGWTAPLGLPIWQVT